MELGGSDPYIVIDSSNLENAIKNSVFARLQNNGQSCIASKRFIIKDDIYNEFYEGMLNEFEKVRTGDQLDENTYVGPLSSEAQKNIILKQVNELKSYGEVIETGKMRGI